MANDLFVKAATFATASMMPVGDEEVNALWGRKMAMNTQMAMGTWGTVILSELSDTSVGSATLVLPVKPGTGGFNYFPTIELFQYRGGTDLAIPAPICIDPLDASEVVGVWQQWRGGSCILFCYPDYLDTTERIFTGSQAQFGTFIYRFMGW